MKTRQKPRKVLTVPGRYSNGRGEQALVRLSDLSVSGCRFAVGGDLPPPGSLVQIIIADRGPFRAEVRWRSKGELGVHFVTPLTPEQFEEFRNSHVFDFSDEGQPADFPPMPGQAAKRFC